MRYALLLLILPLAASPAAGQSTVYWADYLIARGGMTSGGASGLITVGDGEQVEVNYNGPLFGADGVDKGASTQYWVPASTYTSATVANAPPGADLLAFNNPGQGFITFFKPVANPTLTFLDIEQAGYEFDTDFAILSQGPGLYGNGTLSKEVTPAGKFRLNGTGSANGTIRFAGQFTSLPINSLSAESGAAGFDGLTIGIMGIVPVPEPAATLGIIAALGLTVRVAGRVRRRPAPGGGPDAG